MDIPAPYEGLFKRYGSFNALQTALRHDLLHSHKSVVLSAPTGSGKTVAFELAIVRMLLQRNKVSGEQRHIAALTPKAIYVAPLKALCSEKFDDWKSRFMPFNVQCVQITGDSDVADLTAIRDVQLVVTTPEKWDSLTRRWRDCPEIAHAIRLFMIDEVHLLSDVARGPVIEAIVSRMKSIACFKADDHLRFVVASATLPNIEDVTTWIGDGDPSNVLQLAYTFEQRALPLERHILGYNSKFKGFQFDMSLNYKLPDVLRKYSDRKATLIFCNSRKSTEMAAVVLRRYPALFPLSDQQKTTLAQLAERLDDTQLRPVVAAGIAYHHAGLSQADRARIEDGFRQGHLMVLLCTNTLAMGVNLPAHLVVIKSTEMYAKRCLDEYAESTILQMIGRAGRPQFDHEKGVAVVMTYSRNVAKYENLMNGRMPVESHLHKQLAEHLNAEIALGTIDSESSAKRWLRSTFLHVRSLRDPPSYGLLASVGANAGESVERQLEGLCVTQLGALQAAALIAISTDGCSRIQGTHFGRLMAKYYLCGETMRLFRQIRGTETMLELLNWIVGCKEFADFSLRVDEKRPLNALNAAPIRFPIRGRIKTREDKLSCLIQAVFGGLALHSAGLTQEAEKALRLGDRLSKCLLEYLRLSGGENRLNEFHLGYHTLLLHAVTIAKCFHAKLWENSEHAAQQLRKIDVECCAALAEAGKTTLQSIAATDARTIEQILNKPPPFGEEVLQELETLPQYQLLLSRTSIDTVLLSARQTNDLYRSSGSNALLIVGDTANNVLHFGDDLEEVLFETGVYELSIRIKNTEVNRLVANIVHNALVGVDATSSIVINQMLEQSVAATPGNTRTRKRNQQTTLNASIVPKSKRSCPKRLSISTNGATGFDRFRYAKAKLQASHNKSLVARMTRLCDSRKKILNGTLQIFSEPADECTLPLVQTRVTEYFQNRGDDMLNTALPSFQAPPHELSNNSEASEWPPLASIAGVIDVDVTQRHNADPSPIVKSLSREQLQNPLDLSVMKSTQASIVESSSKALVLTPMTIASVLEREPANSEKYLNSNNGSFLSGAQASRVVEAAARNSTAVGITTERPIAAHGRNNYETLHFSFNDSFLNGRRQSHLVDAAGTSLDKSQNSNRQSNCKSTLKAHEREARFKDVPKRTADCDIIKADSTFKENEINDDVSRSPTEETLRRCFGIALAFSKLRCEEQNFANFKRLYLRLNATQILTDSVSGNATTSQVSKRHQSDRSQLAAPAAKSTSAQPPSVKNRFRLQIFKEGVPKQTLRRSSIDSINRVVMQEVNDATCEDNIASDDDSNDKLAEMEVEQALTEIKNESPELTFDEYCARYLQ